MKTIKIKDIEISAEELRRIVSENKELLKEPEVKARYFFPKEGERYWYTYACNNIEDNTNNKTKIDIDRISYGNCYHTEADAKLALDKQKAIVACWKWQQENAPFEPDWGNEGQEKWFAYYNHHRKELRSEFYYNNQHQFTLPYFKSLDETEAFIKACKEHLTLLFAK